MKRQLHGLRQGKVVISGKRKLIADTMSDDEWVILYDQETADAVVRQSKYSRGRVFHQGTNPDYKGRESYSLEYMRPRRTEWYVWNDQSARGAILYDLDRILNLT